MKVEIGSKYEVIDAIGIFRKCDPFTTRLEKGAVIHIGWQKNGVYGIQLNVDNFQEHWRVHTGRLNELTIKKVDGDGMNKEIPQWEKELRKKIDNASRRESSKDRVFECPLCDTSNRVNLDNTHIRILLDENEVLRRSVARWEKSYDEVIESQKRLIDVLTGASTKRGEMQ